MTDECQCAEYQSQTVAELRRESAAELIALVQGETALALQLIAGLAAEMAEDAGLVAASNEAFRQIEEGRYVTVAELRKLLADKEDER